MARISDEQLAKLKNDISLVRLIEAQGYSLKKEGKDHVMCCPFHDDDTPSLKVSMEKNVFNCFGCGVSGTVIDWVMQTQGVSFRHACEILMEDTQGVGPAGMELDGQVRKQSTVPKLTSPVSGEADNQEVLGQVIDYYHECLKQSPEALAYLKARGLDHPELIDTFKLGFANRTLGLRIPEKNRVAGKRLRGQLQEVGIFRKSGHEHLNGSLVVPLFDEAGRVVEAYGRKIRDDLRKGTPKHLYLPGPHAGVFNLDCLKASDEVILCESLIDALTFWNHGYRNVTTSFGTGGFTNELLEAFKSHGVKRVLIAYDRDNAGNKAATELSKVLCEHGMDTFRILFPKNMDANEYALSVQPASQSLGIVIRKAQWMGNAQGGADLAGSRMKPTTKPVDAEKASKATKEKSELASLASQSEPDISTDIPEPGASVMPKHSKAVDADVADHEINMSFDERAYRIRGLKKNLSYEQLKLNVHVMIEDRYHIDTFDLYHARSRSTYIKQASLELGVSKDTIKKDLGHILTKLEELQEQQIKSTLDVDHKPQQVLDEAEYADAIGLLKSPDLLEQITDDLTVCGIVGEEVNKLAAYLGCVSRKLDKPLAIIIQSTSAAGKSTLMDKVIELMPEAEKVQYSAMTGQSLFYMGETSLKHKILAISEEEGAHSASYALKLLQSEGKITIASTGKDETTGNMETKEYSVEGPVMLFMTTTAIDIDEELMNRCLVLTVNETREQTEAIHQIQRQSFTLDGLKADTQKQAIIQRHQNAMSLIKPLKVVNPYADRLTFMSHKTRTRRDHMKYLNLINAIALLHQYQRDVKAHGDIHYIEATVSDIEWANKLAHQILGRTLDELPPQTRNLLEKIKQMVDEVCQKKAMSKCDYRFTRRQIREYTNWGNTQLKVHLGRLEDMEYLLIHRGGRGQSFVYELAYDGKGSDGKAFVCGLIDTKILAYDKNKSGVNGDKSVSSRPQVGGKSVGGRIDKNTSKPKNSKSLKTINGQMPQNTRPDVEKTSGHRVS